MHQIEAKVGEVSVVLLLPDEPVPDAPLVLWLSHLGGSADKERPTLTQLVSSGCAAVSFDPPSHGRRAAGTDPRAFAAQALGDYRNVVWPILGAATLEAMRVITWALRHVDYAPPEVCAGGLSMGGDIAIALAGIDDRVARIATIGSTPDWHRPGMRDPMEPSVIIDQGNADRYAQWFNDALNPSLHIDRYTARSVPMLFELGAADQHISARHAQDFRAALKTQDPGATGDVRLSVRADLDHFGITTDDAAVRSAVHWLTTPASLISAESTVSTPVTH